LIIMIIIMIMVMMMMMMMMVMMMIFIEIVLRKSSLTIFSAGIVHCKMTTHQCSFMCLVM
jgi:hypothetical protein